MRKLVLKIDEKDQADDEARKSLTLPYKTMHATSHLKSESKKNMLKKALTSSRDSLEKLTLNLENRFVALFPLISNVTELNLVEYFTWGSHDKPDFDFPNLKILILFDASAFIDHIRSHKIETLKIAENQILIPPSFFDKGNWKKFFGTCEKLEHLHLQNYQRNIDLCDFNFKLSSLVICRYQHRDLNAEFDDGITYFDPYDFRDKIYALIRAQKDSLKVVKLIFEQKAFPNLISFLFYDMKIEELFVGFDKSQIVYQAVPKENSSIKKLKLIVKNGVSEKFFDVLKTLHAVEELDVDLCSQPNGNELVRFLHSHMANLKILTLRNPRVDQTDESELKALQVESLIIHGLPLDGDQRRKLLTFAPNIKKLFINGSNDDKLMFRDVLHILCLRKLEDFNSSMDFEEKAFALMSNSAFMGAFDFEVVKKKEEI